MKLEEFLNNIKFKFITKNIKTSENKDRLSSKEEIANTLLPENNENIDSIKNLLDIPRMSTLANGAIINKIVSELKENELFVNIGVWNGFTFFSGLIGNSDKKCVGVDNFSEFFPEIAKANFYQNYNFFKNSLTKSENIEFYELDYEEYFNKIHKGIIGFYIYDGEHSYKNQLKGLELAEPFFSENCIILIDDTNIPEVKQSVLDFIKLSKNKYEIIFDVNTANNCHPTFWNGLIILKKL
ncbi:MAG: class I SAM-dependent methyltransferase [Cyanobacteriota bacterium]